MDKYHDIGELNFQNGILIITIDDQVKQYSLKKISPALEKASMKELSNFNISPSGYGIHWPLLDEDISIDGLLGIRHEPQWRREIAI